MKKLIIGGVVLALAAVLLGSSLFVLNAGESAVVTQFGKPVATLTEPGLKWKLPFSMQRVNRIDARTEVFNTKPIQLLLGDKNPIILTTFIAWRVNEPLLYYQSMVLLDTARQKLSDMVVSVMGSVLADYQLDSIINADRNKVRLLEIESRVLERTSTQARQKYGIDVIRIGIRRMSYPSLVADAVYKRMQAEREKEAMKFRAEGTEEAAKIEAATDKEVSEIISEAYKEAEIVKGEGDQTATKIYAEAYSKDPEFFEFLKSTDLYRETMNERTTLILSTESELFRYIQSPSGSKTK